jgi:uncharacterized protein YjiS (DUF1127 family)
MRAAYHSFQDYRARRRAIQTLAAMDEALLKDIGISRSQIHSVVDGLGHDHAGTAGPARR